MSTPDSAAELAQYFTGLYCSECGRFDCPYQPEHRVGRATAAPYHALKSGLLTRCGIRVEGLEWHGGEWWFVNLRGAGRIRIPAAWAADLLVAAVEKAAGCYWSARLKEGGWEVRVNGYAAKAPTRAQAAATAMHRAKDAEERR